MFSSLAISLFCFPAADNKIIRALSFAEKLLSVFENILFNQLNIKGQLKTAINYVISEIFTNITEHSNSKSGWMMIQNYPTKQFLDVCIADNGIGILGSYQKAGFTEIASSKEALNEAINGKSTKIHEKTRGYGIKTSRRMLVNGLGGKYFLFSGNAFYLYTKAEEQITVLKNASWKGTMFALRIPNKEPKAFNYVNYLE